MRRRAQGLCFLALLWAGAAAADQVLTFDGQAPEDGLDHFFVPFAVPEGTAEIEVRHQSLTPDAVLDFGLDDPAGYRGWGGGTGEPAVIGLAAASRAYVPGPLPAGPWRVIIGKARVGPAPARYHLEVELRQVPTLPPQPERRPYRPAPALHTGKRYYAGDLHVHSLQSTDAAPTLGQIAALGRQRGLDFIEISDHNTITQLDFFLDEQARQPDLLLLPGVEFTTYKGHANAIGATRFVDHKLGQPGVSIEGAAGAIGAQGAVLSINHPVLDLGSLCIGCAWRHTLSPAQVGGVEIGTGGYRQVGFLFGGRAIAFWDALLDRGSRAAALGGSDDHSAGAGRGQFDSPIGSPTTLVLAEELSAAAILDGIRRGRTVVKLQGPEDPMVELGDGADAAPGDVLRVRSVRLQAVVRGGLGARVRLVRNGDPQRDVEVATDPFLLEQIVEASAEGEDRWRAEVLVEGEPRTVTSHLWVRRDPDGPEATSAGGCRLSAAPAGRGLPWALGALVLLLWWRRVHRA